MAVTSTQTRSTRDGGGIMVYVADHVDEIKEALAAAVLAIDPYQSPYASPIHVNKDGKFQAQVSWYGLGD